MESSRFSPSESIEAPISAPAFTYLRMRKNMSSEERFSPVPNIETERLLVEEVLWRMSSRSHSPEGRRHICITGSPVNA